MLRLESAFLCGLELFSLEQVQTQALGKKRSKEAAETLVASARSQDRGLGEPLEDLCSQAGLGSVGSPAPSTGCQLEEEKVRAVK